MGRVGSNAESKGVMGPRVFRWAVPVSGCGVFGGFRL